MRTQISDAWQLAQRCKVFGLSPADEFGLEHPWSRWCFNNAIFLLWRMVENKRWERDESVRGKTRYKWTIEDILEGRAYRPQQQISTLLFMGEGDVMDG